MKLPAKSAFSGTLSGSDIMHIVDVSDTSQDSTGSSYKLTLTQLTTFLITTMISDTAYGSGWNGDATTAPSKNAVYDKIETLVLKAGDSLTGSLLFASGYGVDATATGGSDVLNIGVTNADVINIGRSGATVNIIGTLAYENVTNLQVTDKLITINKGGSAASATGAGFEIEENSSITGYFKTVSARNGYELKSPAITYVATFDMASLNDNYTYVLPNGNGTIALTEDITDVISDAAYGAGWNGDSGVAPSKNAVYDKIEAMISDTAYASSWNGVTTIAPSKNAVYDKINSMGKELFEHYANAGNVGTGDDDLYSDTLAAGQLAANGEKITAHYSGTLVPHATASRRLRVYFGGTAIFDSTAIVSSTANAWSINVEIIRVSSSVIRYSFNALPYNALVNPSTVVGELTGLTLANTQILKVTGEAAGVGAATDDIVATFASVRWRPAA